MINLQEILQDGDEVILNTPLHVSHVPISKNFSGTIIMVYNEEANSPYAVHARFTSILDGNENAYGFFLNEIVDIVTPDESKKEKFKLYKKVKNILDI